MDVRIELAGAPDAATLLTLIHAANEEYRGKLRPPVRALSDTAEEVLAKAREGRWVIARVHSKAVGCVYCVERGNRMYLGRLAVLPNYRRHGIGKALMASVEAHALSRGLKAIFVSVRVGLPDLREMYVRAGYALIESHTQVGSDRPTHEILEKTVRGDTRMD